MQLHLERCEAGRRQLALQLGLLHFAGPGSGGLVHHIPHTEQPPVQHAVGEEIPAEQSTRPHQHRARAGVGRRGERRVEREQNVEHENDAGADQQMRRDSQGPAGSPQRQTPAEPDHDRGEGSPVPGLRQL